MEAAENKAKVEMFLLVLAGEAEGATKAVIEQQERGHAQERYVGRSRED